MSTTDTPADYYRRKQQEVDAILALLEEHAASHAACDWRCSVRRTLERRLNDARYVGD